MALQSTGSHYTIKGRRGEEHGTNTKYVLLDVAYEPNSSITDNDVMMNERDQVMKQRGQYQKIVQVQLSNQSQPDRPQLSSYTGSERVPRSIQSLEPVTR